jgi:two-component system sensor histidine kinase VicK
MALPGFRLFWVFLAILLLAFVAAIFVPAGIVLVLIEGVFLIIAGAVVFVSLYQVAGSTHATKIEERELAGILESIDDGVVVYAVGFRVLFFNPGAEKIFKIRASSVIGHTLSPRDIETEGWRTFVQIIFPSLAPRVITRTPENKYPQVVDISFTDPPLEFRVTTSQLMNDDGKIFAFMKVIRDRTSEINAMRSKTEFVTVASHQLRGPVTDVSWALQSLAGATELNDTNKMIVQNALAASQGLLRRIEDLLNIAKMEDGEFGYRFEDSDVSDFIAKTLGDVLPAAQKAGIKIYFDRPSTPLPHVMIDPKRLSLVVVNLLENAIRYNVVNGEVVVKTDQIPGKPFIVVSVRDTGIGIPSEDIPKLFAKFYRAENAMKLQTEGSGLGLYIAKGIVNAHGGEIWAESEMNRGTTISFTLPTDPNLIPKHEAVSEYLL